MKTVIIDYDAGNVKSLEFALERLGVSTEITDDSTKNRCGRQSDFSRAGRSYQCHEQIAVKRIRCIDPSAKAARFGHLFGHATAL